MQSSMVRNSVNSIRRCGHGFKIAWTSLHIYIRGWEEWQRPSQVSGVATILTRCGAIFSFSALTRTARNSWNFPSPSSPLKWACIVVATTTGSSFTQITAEPCICANQLLQYYRGYPLEKLHHILHMLSSLTTLQYDPN